jgi:hypothetical protein
MVANKRQIVFEGLCLLAKGIICPLLLIFSVSSFGHDAECGGVISYYWRWGLYMGQFSEYDPEWGATLGVVKARSNF